MASYVFKEPSLRKKKGKKGKGKAQNKSRASRNTQSKRWRAKRRISERRGRAIIQWQPFNQDTKDIDRERAYQVLWVIRRKRFESLFEQAKRLQNSDPKKAIVLYDEIEALAHEILDNDLDEFMEDPEDCSELFAESTSSLYEVNYPRGLLKEKLYGVASAMDDYRIAGMYGTFADAAYRYAKCRSQGLGGVEIDHREAAKYFRWAAERDHIDAQYEYAEYLANGDWVPLNNELSNYYYKQAADNGHIDAQYFYANRLCLGIVETDHQQAAQYYKLAADHGHVDAAWFYADMLASGEHIENDDPMALKYYSRASSGGLEHATQVLIEWGKTGRGLDHEPGCEIWGE